MLDVWRGRTPPGVRELKLFDFVCVVGDVAGRTPPGVRELKLGCDRALRQDGVRRTPPGVRELKLHHRMGALYANESHPSRGA